MPFTLAAFSSSHASVAVLIVNAIADQHLTVITNRLVVPKELNQIVGLYANGTDVARAQLSSPSLRQFLLPEISPVDVAALPSTPDRWLDYRFTPIQLQSDEQLEFDAANAAAGANICRGLVWLANGPISPVSGDVRSVRVTAAITGIAEAWANGPLVFDQTLPAGLYAVVGARFFGATLNAFRLVFPAGKWRPGGLGSALASSAEPPEQRYGNFGIWDQFNHNAPPTLDILCTAADAAQTGVLDLLKVA